MAFGNWFFFFFQAEDGIRDIGVTGVQTCALPISSTSTSAAAKQSVPVGEVARESTPAPSSAAPSDPQGEEAAQQTWTRWAVAALIMLVSLVPAFLYAKPHLMRDRKSTRLNSSHANISYAVFCLKKKKISY